MHIEPIPVKGMRVTSTIITKVGEWACDINTKDDEERNIAPKSKTHKEESLFVVLIEFRLDEDGVDIAYS